MLAYVKNPFVTRRKCIYVLLGSQTCLTSAVTA